MGAPVYSERLLLTTLSGVWANYVVPPGKRVICRNLTGQCPIAGGGYVALGVEGTNVWLRSLPGATTGFSEEFHIVAYAGELVQVYTSDQIRACLSGYLFDDSSRKGVARWSPYPPTSPEIGWEEETSPLPSSATWS